MQTHTRTIVAVFDDFTTAQRAAARLIERGFRREEVQITSANDYIGDPAAGNTGLTGRSPADTSGGGISGFFDRLFGTDTAEEQHGRYTEEHGRYTEAVRRGGAVVAVTADDAREDDAADILNEFDPVDIDQRAASWQEGGTPVADAEVERGREQRTIPIVQEELRVGKRAVQKGGVRVFNRVYEEPVEQEVNLSEEHVRVDRRAANRPATESDVRMQDEVIEVREMAEEPVVQKTTRVVEEVVVGKETKNRTETVRDTVRKTDVNVEQMGAGTADRNEYEDDFRRDFQSRYSLDRSANFESYAPAYRYGYRMASDARYSGRSWDDVESTLKTDYERNNPNSTWDQIKGAVRYGWEKVTGKR
jgi:uncharacterized protein (TIGR02271 family)